MPWHFRNNGARAMSGELLMERLNRNCNTVLTGSSRFHELATCGGCVGVVRFVNSVYWIRGVERMIEACDRME